MSSFFDFFSYNQSVLSGAMDIIVVKQPDETYKHSPFRIRFGSFKVLRAKEKIVNIMINGQKSDITMRLSECGEAYFMTEVKKILFEESNLSDGYSSPIELGTSAPSSPAKKKSPLEINGILDSIPTIAKENLHNQNIEEKFQLNQALVSNSEEVGKINESERSEFEYEKFSEITDETVTIKEHRQRKLSYDVFSRNESNSSKLKLCRANEFTIDSYKKSINRIELSNSWNQISKIGKGDIEELFSKHKISKDEFFKDPWKILNNNNLAIKNGDYLYTWKVIAPLIVSQLAYNDELPINVMNNLIQQQQGFLLWKTINLEAFKIDLKKIKESKNESNTEKEAKLDAVNNDNNKAKIELHSSNDGKVHISPNSASNQEITKKIETARRQSFQYKKTYTLSSDQMKSLKLNPGKNEISFIVSSRYQGTHVLTTDIYLWDSEDKIFISDLDGTITRSDVLGHIFPLFGKDWSHKGVVKLYNDIVKNGYKVIYLTARAICQSDQTKNYLRNKLVQNNLKLPHGPLLMSPDGLVSSFKREVIDRTPQSFKIACLTQILNLFPPDAKPFFAGFGNKLTDAIAYESVGINKSKIFIINEKGEISQYNNYYRTSYVQINEMFLEMFPPLNGNNTYFGNLNYFKPVQRTYDIKMLFS